MGIFIQTFFRGEKMKNYLVLFVNTLIVLTIIIFSIVILSSLAGCNYTFNYFPEETIPATETQTSNSNLVLKADIREGIYKATSPTFRSYLRNMEVPETNPVVINTLEDFIEFICNIILEDGDTTKVQYYVNLYWPQFISVLTYRLEEANSPGDNDDGEEEEPPINPAPPIPRPSTVYITLSWGVFPDNHPRAGEDVTSEDVYSEYSGFSRIETHDIPQLPTPNPFPILRDTCINANALLFNDCFNYTSSVEYVPVSRFLIFVDEYPDRRIWKGSWGDFDFSVPIFGNTTISVIWESEEPPEENENLITISFSWGTNPRTQREAVNSDIKYQYAANQWVSDFSMPDPIKIEWNTPLWQEPTIWNWYTNSESCIYCFQITWGLSQTWNIEGWVDEEGIPVDFSQPFTKDTLLIVKWCT